MVDFIFNDFVVMVNLIFKDLMANVDLIFTDRMTDEVSNGAPYADNFRQRLRNELAESFLIFGIRMHVTMRNIYRLFAIQDPIIFAMMVPLDLQSVSE